MNATAEIDKAGRIVVPKKFRDSLHLVAGTRLSVEEIDGKIVLAPEAQPGRLYMDCGTLVYDAGPVPPSDVVAWIREDREARDRAVAGDGR